MSDIETESSVTATAEMIDDLVRRAAQLDRSALDGIVDLYSSRLYGFLYRMTGRRDEAEDLVQEVFLRVVRTIGGYEHDGRFEAWLFRIAGNVARDRARRQSCGPRSQSMSSAEDGVVGPSGSDRDDVAAEERRTERLQEAIGRLPDGEREVILLRHYAELSFAEIARMMATPVGTALARAHRGLAKLRRMLENEE